MCRVSDFCAESANISAHAHDSMGGLCRAMAELVFAAAAGSQEEGLSRKEGGEEEDWEDEVDMGVFYTDAAKYWEV